MRIYNERSANNPVATIRIQRMFPRLAAVWAYRSFIFGSVQREFQMRYRSSLLGAAWTIINPLAMILTYTVIFSRLMHSKLPGVEQTFGYSIYLCAGLITWGLFAEIVLRSQTMFLENANLIKKLTFPRLCLPAIVLCNAWLNFLVIFALFIGFLLLTQQLPGWPLLAVIPILLVQSVFAVGLGIIIGVLNVFFRDVGQLFGIVLQFWFWFTPIVYPVSILPEWARALIALNPMAAVIDAYHSIFVGAQWPHWPSLGLPLLCSMILCLLGFRLMRRRADEMVDEL
jgi:lipopolysaccharide transport system permease protein